MLVEKIDLYKYFNLDRKDNCTGGYLTAYARKENPDLKRKLRPAMLILPGGGYCYVSGRESEPVALEYLYRGYSAFVLEYSTNTAYPEPLIEACMAVLYIRENAVKYNVDREHVGAIGFSAGGHLAAMLANIYNEKEIKDIFGKKTDSIRLNAVVLCYPVITTGEFTHECTRNVISGGNAELAERLSMEKRVTPSSVPAFIWHTFEDNSVPVENSLMLASAYKKAGVPFALHIFEKGWHGLSICKPEIDDDMQQDKDLRYVGQWLNLSVDWLISRGFCVKN